MKKFLLSLLSTLIFVPVLAQNTFPSPGAQVICSTTSNSLSSVTASDGVTISSSLRLNAPCLDTDLASFSLNSPAQYRKPTYCYNNGYFPSSYGNPLAISRNSTANTGNCTSAESAVVARFTGSVKPEGLSFIVCDVDNPYDTIRVQVYSNGALVDYTFQFMESNPALSYAWTNNTTGSGNSVNFNGGANGVWGESSATTDWEKGAIKFQLPTSVAVDSIIVTHIIRNNRSDINAAISIGAFNWVKTSLPVTLVDFNISNQPSDWGNESVHLNWQTTFEKDADYFDVEKSNTGKSWEAIGRVKPGTDGMGGKYSFIDPKPFNGNNYYRLKMVDTDDAFAYSGIKSIHIKWPVSLYPNPVSETLNISLPDWSDIRSVKLLNGTGKQVYESNSKHENSINVSKFPSGIYLLNIYRGNGDVLSKKIVVAQ